MKVKFGIETLGYIIAEFFDGDRKAKIFHSSDYGDGFQELLNKLFWIYDIVVNDKQEYYPCSFETQWRDDFVIFSWSVGMESKSSNIFIKINELSPANDAYRIELINTEISFKDLFEHIYLSLDDIFNRFGFVGYKKNWEIGNFPSFEYIILKSHELRINLSTTKYSNEDDEWMGKVEASDEVNIVNLFYEKR